MAESRIAVKSQKQTVAWQSRSADLEVNLTHDIIVWHSSERFLTCQIKIGHRRQTTQTHSDSVSSGAGAITGDRNSYYRQEQYWVQGQDQVLNLVSVCVELSAGVWGWEDFCGESGKLQGESECVQTWSRTLRTLSHHVFMWPNCKCIRPITTAGLIQDLHHKFFAFHFQISKHPTKCKDQTTK